MSITSLRVIHSMQCASRDTVSYDSIPLRPSLGSGIDVTSDISRMLAAPVEKRPADAIESV